MKRYTDRKEAGQVLAEFLRSYANKKDVIILALPRGGVPVAYEVSQTLNAPLDVFIVRKLGVPGHPELAMGAIASGDITVFNEDILQQLHVSEKEIAAVIEREQRELIRREKAYRGNKPSPSLENKVVILIDDGIATGATMRAAIKALNQLAVKKLVVAVPVADISICEMIEILVDQFICPLQPEGLHAVGAWYDDFSQTEDEEVHALLHE
jgi:putative phosphoribosyl transferase